MLNISEQKEDEVGRKLKRIKMLESEMKRLKLIIETGGYDHGGKD
jgi:hypothetical protein